MVVPGDTVKPLSPSESVSCHSVKNGGRHAETGRVCTGVWVRPSVRYSVSVGENRHKKKSYI